MNTAYQNITNIFRLIRVLDIPRSVQQLASTLNVNQRKVYRYIEILKEQGYPISKTKDHRYFLETVTTLLPDTQLPDDFQLNECLPIIHQLPVLRLAQHIQLLQLAINQCRKAILINYHSPKDGLLSKRIVHPLYLSPDFKRLQVYDESEKKQRQYKLQRLENISLTTEQFKNRYTAQPFDDFGLSGPTPRSVKLQLSSRAYHLLIEEFPITRQSTNIKDKHYFYENSVRSWLGIGRFILGLPEEIVVLKGEGLMAYLRGKGENS